MVDTVLVMKLYKGLRQVRMPRPTKSSHGKEILEISLPLTDHHPKCEEETVLPEHQRLQAVEAYNSRVPHQFKMPLDIYGVGLVPTLAMTKM